MWLGPKHASCCGLIQDAQTLMVIKLSIKIDVIDGTLEITIYRLFSVFGNFCSLSSSDKYIKTETKCIILLNSNHSEEQSQGNIENFFQKNLSST